ncbi:hypothetical protein [Flavobacterium phycosphaerae]|uniref:hypothetical protein n=1 Tax=Flavobacterium phycosphaerae TaxID=2697515 RepID=UPI001389702B|nr:hypothetical protein [Flavobacterium phycosphaerae]
MKEKNPFEDLKLDKKSVAEAIESLNSLDLEKVEIDDLKKIIQSTFKLIPFHQHIIPAGQKYIEHVLIMIILIFLIK